MVGVPIRAPATDRVRPGGSAPERTRNMVGGEPPLAARLAEYGMPTPPAGSEAPPRTRRSKTRRASALVTREGGFALSVTCTISMEVPAAVGVPRMVPPASTRRPAGRVPPASDHLYGAVPPAALSVAE